MSKFLRRSDAAQGYSFAHTLDDIVTAGDFMLHQHDGYEVLIFYCGDAEFIVEGSVYALRPFDVVIARENEMHRIFHRSPVPYERVVLGFEPVFFQQNNCMAYQEIFINRKNGKGNVLRSEAVLESDLLEIVARIERYIKEEDETVIRCALVEFLYTLNQLKNAEVKSAPQNRTVRAVTQYINENLGGDLRLDTLAEKFYVSKYHLCRVFKACTGYTLNRYIINKRLQYAEKLCRDGIPIGTAATMAGFGDYSCFYKAYVRERGIAPRDGMRAERRPNALFYPDVIGD